MTQFKQISIMYEQFDKMVKEIDKLIEKEDYENITAMVKERDKFAKQLFIAKKTVNFTDEEAEQIKVLDREINRKNKKLLEFLKTQQQEVGQKLDITKKKVKISSAYTPLKKNRTGRLIDTSE